MISIPRKVQTYIQQWAASPARKTLLVRGARQVGKTYLARKLKEQFRYFLEVNFVSDRRSHSFFSSDLDIAQITEQLSAFYNVPLRDGETVLFFDEIQECPAALSALRFFYEKRPGLHVVAAGSLLEFALAELPSFGVGRIQSLFVYPVTFDEFLAASGQAALLDYLQKAGPAAAASRPIHEKLIDYFKSYTLLGGLPEVVATFLEHRNYQQCASLIDSLRLSYEDDFVKYKKRVPETRLREVLRSVSLQAGKKFVHTHAYPDANAGQVHQALEVLTQAGLVHKIYHAAGNGVPLGAETNLKKFKTIPFDHGVYQRMLGITPAEIIRADFNPINKGALAEVYCGTALLAHSNALTREGLFYWHREAKSSNAEVDYLVQFGDKIVPIEIKAATKGAMQSMFKFLSEKKNPIGIRCSLENFGRIDKVLVVPLYGISQLERIISEFSG